MALDWLSAGASVFGSGVSGLLGKSSSDKMAKAIKSEGKAQRAYLEKYASPIEIRGGVSPVGATISADPKQQYMINPAIAGADLSLLPATSEGLLASDKELKKDLMRSREYYEQQAKAGIDPETQRLIMRSVKEQAGQQVKEGLQATQAGLVAGQAGGGALKQRQDQIVSAGAQMVGNQQYDLALKSIASKQEAVDKLISLGQTEKANELQNQQIEESRILTNNTILDNLRNYEVDNINRFNNLVLSMKSIATQQGAAIAQVSAQTTADLIKVNSEYNNMVNSTIKSLTDTANTLWKDSVRKSLNLDTNNQTSIATEPIATGGFDFSNTQTSYA